MFLHPSGQSSALFRFASIEVTLRIFINNMRLGSLIISESRSTTVTFAIHSPPPERYEWMAVCIVWNKPTGQQCYYQIYSPNHFCEAFSSECFT